MEFKYGSNLLQGLFICMMGGFWHKKKEREYGTGSSRGEI
jgi:hypothetical protein